jgi:hypothetical protein
MSRGKTETVAYEDSKGRAIRKGPYSLEALSFSQGHLNGVLNPRIGQLQNQSKASGTLGAHSASQRACHVIKI